MAWILEQLGSAYELARLAVISRCRWSGAYWQWREHTAFGRGRPEGGRLALVKATWHYGRWAYRMRRGL